MKPAMEFIAKEVFADQRGAGALLVGSGPFLNDRRQPIVALAAGHALPASYS